MEPVLTRCGYRCDLCLAYRPNLELHPENQQVLSDGWFKYFGFRIPPEEIICDGCLEENPRLVDTSCQVRPCVIEHGLANCAACKDYICEKLIERIVTLEEVRQRLRVEIPREDYERFILPYENKQRLDGIRAAGIHPLKRM